MKEINRLAVGNRAFAQACTPGYYNNEGQPGSGLGGATYTPGINAFNALLAKWREQGSMDGYELS